MRKVKLYGPLAKFVGHRVLEADVQNAAEAVRFLICNWPELEKHMADQYYSVKADTWEISEDELHFPTGKSDIKIIPVVGGAGGSTGRILLGVALIGASFLLPGAGMFGAQSLFGATAATGWTAAGIGTVAGTMLSGIGAALVLGGISEMLTPVPKTPESVQDPENSFSFSGTGNSTRAGLPVPVIFGRVLTGSITISMNVDTVQVEA
jgi:predicted phage tail protein